MAVSTERGGNRILFKNNDKNAEEAVWQRNLPANTYQ
jgi:hypothetical protein